jgi:tetratricopeptide (TPR) repeat protein
MSYNLVVKTLAAILLLGLGALPAAAQNYSDVAIDHETWSVVGWNDACGVAFEHFYYPKLGDAMAYEPISVRIGTAKINSGSEKYVGRYALETDGAASYDERAIAKVEKELKAAGFSRKGFPETILDAPIGNQPLLAEAILSTTTLAPRATTGWPGPEWRWAGGNFSPLATCELLVFEKRDQPKRYRLLLVRVYNPRVRQDRAYAHASNARLLFNAGNLEVAAPEAETAALLAPELPIARYEHAAMLALTGHPNEAADELQAAIKLEPKYVDKAREDLDFESLHDRDDFKEMMK